MGQLGWIDFSSTHRDRVHAVLDFLQEEGTVDELGIGTIRNALADFFFPGISTIQTRAKYFFIIPRIIHEYQHQYSRQTKRPTLSEFLRKRENEIIRQLAERYQGSEENGIIGITLANAPASQELARKPSTIYWNGLRVHDIIRTHLSLSDYQRWHDRPHHSLHDLLRDRGDQVGDDRDAGYNDHYGIDLPDYAGDWSENLSIELNPKEAVFLRDKMRSIQPDSGKHPDNLLSQVLSSDEWMEKFNQARDFREMYALMREEKLSPGTIRMLELADDFNHVIRGAHVRYNVLLHRRFGSPENARKFEEEWANWFANLHASGRLDRFEVDFLLAEVASRTKPFTRRFVREWCEAMKNGADPETVDRLVKTQEIRNKGGKARLRERAEESVSTWVGLDWLEYRFSVAKTMVDDIKRGCRLAGRDFRF